MRCLGGYGGLERGVEDMLQLWNVHNAWISHAEGR